MFFSFRRSVERSVLVLLNPILIHHQRNLEGGKGGGRYGPCRGRVDRKDDANHAPFPEVLCQEKAECNNLLLCLLLTTNTFLRCSSSSSSSSLALTAEQSAKALGSIPPPRVAVHNSLAFFRSLSEDSCWKDDARSCTEASLLPESFLRHSLFLFEAPSCGGFGGARKLLLELEGTTTYMAR